METGIIEVLEPTLVKYSARTSSGESITGDIYTLNKGTMLEAYNKLSSKLNIKEKLSSLCLQVL